MIRAATARPARKESYLWPSALIVWLLLLLLTLPKDFVSLFTKAPTATASSAGSLLNAALWLVLMAAGTLLLLLRLRDTLLLLRQVNTWFLLFCVLALLSTVWSAAPAITLERVRKLLTIAICCIAPVLIGWNPRRLQQLVRPCITWLLGASIVYGLIFPTLAIHHGDPALEGAWHGLTFQKNIFGGVATYGVILWYHAWLARDTARWKAMAGGAIALTCVLLSHSSTSLLTTMFSLFFLTLTLRSSPGLRRYMPYFVALFIGLVALYALAALGLVPALHSLLDPITAATGKNAATATGRAPIWVLIEAEIARHPYLGIGYGAYWVGADDLNSASHVFVTQLNFYAGSAHEGYLEVTNDLGYAGLLCLIGYILTYTRQSLRLWRTDRYQAALFLSLLFQQGLENLSEAEWFQITTLNFVMMTLATYAMARGLQQQRTAALPRTRNPMARLRFV